MKKLNLFSVIMISVIAVDSIRSLTIGAMYGSSLIFYYLLAGILFLIPSAYITAELASTWPETGGLYVWVRQAFGARIGFIATWFLWVYNVIWFPTILAFMCATLLKIINPNVTTINNHLLLIMMLSIFWLTTVVNCFGTRISSGISTIGATIGTIIPMLCIIALGISWVLKGAPLQITLDKKHIIPTFNLKSLGLLTGILFGLVGMEVSASFAGEVDNPQKNFPIAMFIAAAIILSTLIFGSLAVAAIIPKSQINLASGVMDALAILLHEAKRTALLPWFGTAIFIGSIGGLSTWMAGPSRNLMRAAQEGHAPSILSRTNRFNAPAAMLLIQGVIFTLLCGIFILFPKFNSAYWLLSDITSQLSIIVYLLIFAAVIYLRYSQPDRPRPFKIPGGKIGVWLIAGISWVTCLIVFSLGFIPPEQLGIVNTKSFEIILCTGIITTLFSGIIISKKRN